MRVILRRRCVRAERHARLTVALLGLGILSAGCALFTGPSSTSLRIRNEGTSPLLALRVIFPETAISFGDVAGGATTDYRTVPGGAYRYSAFTFTHEGQAVSQLVDDWVGEVPLEGRRFTYRLKLFTNSQGEPGIAILGVAKDR